MKTFWTILKIAGKGKPIDRPVEPLDHPELARMTLAELADLPMPAYTRENRT